MKRDVGGMARSESLGATCPEFPLTWGRKGVEELGVWKSL